MKKFNKITSLILALVIILSATPIGFAQSLNESSIKTGFYLNVKDGKNIFIDIYTYLNNKVEYLEMITESGLDNVLFVEQHGKGAKLSEIQDESKFRGLELEDFAEVYKDARTDAELNPKDAYYKITAGLDKKEYLVDDEITLSGLVLQVKEGLGNVEITLKLESDELEFVDQIKTNEYGVFEVTFQLPEGTKEGTYKLTVRADEPVNKTIELDLVIVGEAGEIIVPEEIIGEIADEIKDIIDYIDEEDKAAIISAKSAIPAIEYVEWDEILKDILTDELVGKFDSKEEARGELVSAIAELALIQYSVESEDLQSSLIFYAETHLPTFRAIFGNDVSAETIFGFIKDLMVNLPQSITPSQGNDLVEAKDEEMIALIEEIIKEAVIYTLNKEEYEDLKGKLSELGLSVDTLLAAKTELTKAIDKDNLAQIALINAYARSKAEVTELILGETREYTLEVLGRDVSTLANWSSSDESVATIEVDKKVVLTGLSEGTTTITAYRGDNEANWIVRFEVTVSEKEVIIDNFEEVEEVEIEEEVEEIMDEVESEIELEGEIDTI